MPIPDDLMPKISVIMSVYNGERYLGEAVESILNQTFRDFEFIIVDDGLSDNSLIVINNYAEKDGRIKIIKNEQNIGLTKSLNKALKSAQGEYIARMDCDDVSFPDRFEKQVSFLKDNAEIGIVGCNAMVIDDKGGNVKEVNMPRDINSYLKKRNCFIHGSVMFRGDIIKKIGGYNEEMTYAQDYEMWLRASRIYKIGFVDGFLYKWRVHKGAIFYKRFFSQIFYTALAKTRVLHNKDKYSLTFLINLTVSFFYIYKAGFPLLLKKLSIIK